MPTPKNFIKKYLGWCGWYPCIKKKTIKKWCYSFSEGRVRRWLFYCQYEGKEGDTWYTWSGACLGFGSGWFYNKEVCFKQKISKGRLPA